MNNIQIVLIDDHAIVRDGLRVMIDSEDGLEVVGEASNGQEALEIIRTLLPDVAVLDVSMPVMNGIELMEQLAAERIGTKVLALTAHEDRLYLQRLFSMGVLGYLLKRSARDELIRAIKSVAQGIRYLDPTILAGLVNGVTTPTESDLALRQVALSDREEEVLRLIAQGFSNKEIAARIGISVKTVETHKSRSMNKLGLRGRADIVRIAVERDWLRDM